MQLLNTYLIYPVALAHFVFRKYLLRVKKWTLQKSVDHLWSGHHAIGWAQRKDAREAMRLKFPKLLYDADINIEYGRYAQARENIDEYLRKHPDDSVALELLNKLPV